MLIDYEALFVPTRRISPVTVNAVQTPAYQILDRMLETVQGVPLAWMVRDGMLRVTTQRSRQDTW